MTIALISSTTVLQVGDHRTLFPNTSFPDTGPSDEFLAENNAMRVVSWLEHDSSTHKLVACDPFIDGDHVVTVQVEPLSAEELQARIQPDWAGFKAFALTHPGLNAAIVAAMPTAPAAALGLPMALLQAQQGGGIADFEGCWRAVATAAPASPELVAELIEAATSANLPAEFAIALDPQAHRIRARNEDGTFRTDDPSTPDVNEAWVEAET